MIDISRVEEHVRVADRWGHNARQELSAEEVTEVCRLLLNVLVELESEEDSHKATSEALRTALKQRDSANGKLSAANKKIKQLEEQLSATKRAD